MGYKDSCVLTYPFPPDLLTLVRFLTRQLHTILSRNRGFRDHRGRPRAVHFLGRRSSQTYAWNVAPSDIWRPPSACPTSRTALYAVLLHCCFFFLFSWLLPPLAVAWGTALQAGRSRVRFQMVMVIFHWHNPSGRTMALGLTLPLTEMSTRNIFGGVKAACA